MIKCAYMYKLHFRISFIFFILAKKEDEEEHLKEKNNMYREKLQKHAGRMHFVIASKEHSADATMAIFMLEMFKSSQYDFDV